MFMKIRSTAELKQHVPEFTVICAPSFLASPVIDGTRTETFIIVNFGERIALIGGSSYGGEIKKTIFSVLNFLLPLQGVLPMHCSANVGAEGDVALFFGLSGTGKTTLSADPLRSLIGDDEHGWSDNGIFNFEDGCYAKVIRLSPEAEPQIHACTRRFGTILENVVLDPLSRRLDLNDDALTENTRGAYPLDYIENYLPPKMAGHPRNLVLLTCDASGVVPPIARLTPDQAIYHFISGYTSKIAGTEIGLGAEPEITFSTCFGGPFMVHHPYVYAGMLKARLLQHGTACWLVNTGWTGGPFGVGKRISIGHTRALLNAALSGRLKSVGYRSDPVFAFEVPTECEGVPQQILNPANTWPSREEYDNKYKALAARFIENFKLMADGCPKEVGEAGPRIHIVG
jgi:phosphoenolpyruvate carboxykinase (ATP)